MGKERQSEYWNQAARKKARKNEFDELLAEQYRRTHLDLLSRWIDFTDKQVILKTDLFAEALHPHRSFLWKILEAKGKVIGIDISDAITSRARKETANRAPGATTSYITADVREIPFAPDSFDTIISDSTLDHFHHKHEIFSALSELNRVLKPGGILIITLDNKSNYTEPFFRILVSLNWYRVFVGKTLTINELKKALEDTGLQVVDTTALIHNPRFFARGAVTLIRKIEPVKFNRWLRKGLRLFDSLENKRTKYITAQFIAAKAIKPPA